MSWGNSNHKYGSKKVDHAGYSFASKLEAALFDLLKLRERAGEIAEIQVQDTIRLTKAEIIYKPDFRFVVVATGLPEWAEAKGLETPEWRIKRRLWLAYGPGPLHVYKGAYNRIKHSETLVPKEAA